MTGFHRALATLFLCVLVVLPAGCRGAGRDRPEPFQTSGDPSADQRADQRVTETERARESDGEEGHSSLWLRLGEKDGVLAIVDDFVARVIADPRANWQRAGVERRGRLGIGGREVPRWEPTREELTRLRLHLAQFIAVTSGGPAQYDGGMIREVHAGMRVTNSEFDASIGALKATLDALGIGVGEQRELLAIFESTRAQIVEER